MSKDGHPLSLLALGDRAGARQAAARSLVGYGPSNPRVAEARALRDSIPS